MSGAKTLASIIKDFIKKLAEKMDINLPDDWQKQVDVAVDEWQKGQKNETNNPSMPDKISLLNDIRQFLKDYATRPDFVSLSEQQNVTSNPANLSFAAKLNVEVEQKKDSDFGVVGEPKADSAAAIEKGYAAIKVMQDPTATPESREAAGVALTESVATLKADPAHFSGIDSANFHCSNDLYSLEKTQERFSAEQKATPDLAKDLTAAVMARKQEAPLVEPTTSLATVNGLTANIKASVTATEADKVKKEAANKAPPQDTTPAATANASSASRPSGPRP